MILTVITLNANSNKNGDRLSEKVMPTLGCWFWAEAEFEPNGYKKFINQFSLNSCAYPKLHLSKIQVYFSK